MRFKTGTPARVDRRTLRTDEMTKQEGDKDGHAFSFLSERKNRNKACCWLTFTNEETHKIIRDNLDRGADVQRRHRRHRPSLLPVD